MCTGIAQVHIDSAPPQSIMKKFFGIPAVGVLAGLASFPFLTATPANACVVVGNQALFTYADASVSGYTCTVGDKTVSNINLGSLDSQSTFNFIDNTSFNFHTLSVQGNISSVATGSWSYRIAATSPSMIYEAQTQPTLGLASGTSTSTLTVLSGIPTSVTSGVNGAQSPIMSFGPGVSFVDVTTSWVATPGESIATITDKFSQTQPVVPTPGPLPLLGAGAAFGFSRRLRQRVKLAK